MSKIAFAAALVVGLAASAPAGAAVITQYVNVDTFGAPYTFTLGTGTFTFGVTDASFFADATVQTGGTGAVAATGAPFYDPPRPSSFFTDRGSVGPALGAFLSFATPSAAPFSASPTAIAFRFGDSDGLHYGYAEVAGSTFTGFSYETVAGAGLDLAPINAPVPEPSSWALLIAGFGLTGAMLRRRKMFEPRLLVSLRR